MDYFSGLTFSLGGTNPSHLDWHRHVPTYYGIQYNHAGTLRLRVDHRIDVSLEGACAFISHPGAFFEYGTANGKPRSHNFVCFFGPRVKAFIEGGLIDLKTERPLRRISHPQRFLQTLSELAQAVNGRAGGRLSQERMALMLEDLLLQMEEGGAESCESATEKDSWLREFVAELESSPEGIWDFHEEAQKRNITPEHFRRLFKKVAGMPPQQYLIQLRLRRAAGLLVEGEASVSEIAEQVGIGSEFYFSRLFKDRFAMPPSRYRKEFAIHS